MKLEVTKTNLILAAVILILAVYIVVTSRSHTPTNDLKYKTEIDSLNQAISKYQQHQLLLDRKISDYELDINKLDREIDSAKRAIIDQRKYYGDKIKNAGRYTSTELDSFFSERYQ
jgi:peptidoglycan hydrolase CwlO-like protein